MCEERKKALRLRTTAEEIKTIREEIPTDFPDGKHPNHCIMTKLMIVMAKDRETHLMEAAIDLDNKANIIESETALQRQLRAIKEFLRPILIPLAAAIIAIYGSGATQDALAAVAAIFK